MLAPRSRVFRDDSSLLIRLESADSTRVCFCDSSLCVTRVIIGSSQSQVKSFLVVTRVKSSHFGSVTRVKSSHFGLPTRVKSSHHKMRLESTRVRVSDLTCYNTGKYTWELPFPAICKAFWDKICCALRQPMVTGSAISLCTDFVPP